MMSYKHIIVAIDLSESSDAVINRAVALAKNHQAKLSFVTVDIHHPDNDTRLYDDNESRLVNETYEAMMAKLTSVLGNISYPIEHKIVVMGHIEDKLIQTVNRLEADLLISGHHHGFWHLWWSSANKLIKISPVDLLLISI